MTSGAALELISAAALEVTLGADAAAALKLTSAVAALEVTLGADAAAALKLMSAAALYADI